MSSSVGQILGVVGAEGSGAGLRLLVRWAEGQPPESLPADLVQRLWPQHALAFYRDRVSTPTQPQASKTTPPKASKKGPSEAKTAPPVDQRHQASSGGYEVKEEPAPEPDAAPKTQKLLPTTKKPPGRPKKRVLATVDEEPPVKKAKEAGASRQSSPPPGPSEERSRSSETLLTRACRLAAKAYADCAAAEQEEEEVEVEEQEEEEVGADQGPDGEEQEEEQEHEGEEREEEEGSPPTEPKGRDGVPKFGFPCMVRKVLAECEGEEKTRGLDNATIMGRVQRRFQIAKKRSLLKMNIRMGLHSLLGRSLVVVVPGGVFPNGPFVLTALGREEWTMKRFCMRAELSPRSTPMVLGPLVKAELERQPGGLLYEDLLARLSERFEAGGRELRHPKTGRHVLKIKLRRFVKDQLGLGGLRLGEGGDRWTGPFLAGHRVLVRGTSSALVRQGMAALDGPRGFTRKQLYAWGRDQLPQGRSGKAYRSFLDVGQYVVLRDFARGLLTLVPGGDPCKGPFRLTHR